MGRGRVGDMVRAREKRERERASLCSIKILYLHLPVFADLCRSLIKHCLHNLSGVSFLTIHFKLQLEPPAFLYLHRKWLYVLFSGLYNAGN